MQLINKTLQSTAGNLAVDEWMLESCDTSTAPRELFRVWENYAPAVILGRSSKFASEVNVDHCQKRGIEILRRCSGGASVAIGPGCLMYAVVLDYRLRPELRMLDEAHRFVMKHIQSAVAQTGVDVQYQGTCDLTIDDCKFSGNSMRCKRNCLLYHGTLLYDFPLNLISECLATPPRQPDYRAGRDHGAFVRNLPVTSAALTSELLKDWQLNGADVESKMTSADSAAIQDLVDTKYTTTAWTQKL